MRAANHLTLRSGFEREIPDEEWRTYAEVFAAARERGIPFLAGGALSVAAYTGTWRNTKDLDLFILRAHRDAFVELLSSRGFTDLWQDEEYERHWIYRGTRDGLIVDLIWQMPNDTLTVESAWFDGAPDLVLRGEEIRIARPEELIRAKLFVMQRTRCDWTDLLNVVHAVGTHIDWNRLVRQLGSHVSLLTALLAVFAWICPAKAAELPPDIWNRVGLDAPSAGNARCDGHPNAALLDSRPWFALGDAHPDDGSRPGAP